MHAGKRCGLEQKTESRRHLLWPYYAFARVRNYFEKMEQSSCTFSSEYFNNTIILRLFEAFDIIYAITILRISRPFQRLACAAAIR